MIRAAILGALIAAPVFADPRMVVSGSVVEIGPTEVPNAVAEVTFTNVATNGPQDNGQFQVDFGGVVASITFRWNANEAGDDEIYVDPGPGFVAVPPVLQVTEGGVGTVVIYRLDGVGF